MKQATRAEATKLSSVRSNWWLLVSIAACLAALGAAIAATLDIERCGNGGDCNLDPTKASLGGVWLAQVAVVALAALVVGSEYETHQIRMTLTATPGRLTVLAAKATVVTTVVIVSSAIGTITSVVVARVILVHNGLTRALVYPPLSFADGATLRAAVGTVIYLVLVALLTVGLAACLRDTATTIVAVLSALYLFPMLGLVVTNPTWQHRIDRYAPMNAGLSIQSTRHHAHLAIGPWAGLAVLACYAAAASVVGAIVLVRRDA